MTDTFDPNPLPNHPPDITMEAKFWHLKGDGALQINYQSNCNIRVRQNFFWNLMLPSEIRIPQLLALVQYVSDSEFHDKEQLVEILKNFIGHELLLGATEFPPEVEIKLNEFIQ